MCKGFDAFRIIWLYSNLDLLTIVWAFLSEITACYRGGTEKKQGLPNLLDWEMKAKDEIVPDSVSLQADVLPLWPMDAAVCLCLIYSCRLVSSEHSRHLPSKHLSVNIFAHLCPIFFDLWMLGQEMKKSSVNNIEVSQMVFKNKSEIVSGFAGTLATFRNKISWYQWLCLWVFLCKAPHFLESPKVHTIFLCNNRLSQTF